MLLSLTCNTCPMPPTRPPSPPARLRRLDVIPQLVSDPRRTYSATVLFIPAGDAVGISAILVQTSASSSKPSHSPSIAPAKSSTCLVAEHCSYLHLQHIRLASMLALCQSESVCVAPPDAVVVAIIPLSCVCLDAILQNVRNPLTDPCAVPVCWVR